MDFKKNIFSKSISAKLIASFLAISLIPIAIIGIISFKNASSALKELEFDHLETVGFKKTEQIIEYFKGKFIPLDILAESDDTRRYYDMLKNYHDNGGGLPNGNYDIENQRYKNIYAQMDPFFGEFAESFEFDDVFYICKNHGHVMYTHKKRTDLGTNLMVGRYKDTQLATLWRKVIETEKHQMIDFSIYEPTGKPEAFIGSPIYNDERELIAVIIFALSKDKINGIMTDNHGLGKTGETYLVGEDYYMRSDSRFESESTILRKKVETESVKLALEEESGVHVIDDYRGKEVLSYHNHLSLNEHFGTDFDWVLLAEIEIEEALDSAYFLEKELLIIGLIIGIVALLFALFIAKYFTTPIQQITKIAKLISKGDFSQKIQIKRSDEIGTLAKSFVSVQEIMDEKANQALLISEGDLTMDIKPLSEKDVMGKAFKIMVERLNDQLMEINGVVSELTSSNAQLMSTITELSTSASETATTVSEITTTIEEVKQTAEMAAQKAKNVASSAQKSIDYSDKGIKATEDSVDGMNHIQDQVKQIAETIIKLSEQSQTIGDITNSVNDLAEQSNLLAVNASIEAVKAGEFGKGFGVVAQEIRALSDQSKQATNQIRDILNDVQKTISSAVMATEQGGKAVDNGVTLAEASGDSISMLADSVSEATMASTQIAASSQQQLTGMEQLTSAMENIKQAASQNAAGAKQAQDAVSNIKNIVVNLKGLTNKYKTA